MDKKIALTLGLCAVVGVLAVVSFVRNGSGPLGSAPSDAERLDRLEALQASQFEALNEKIDRLASLAGAPSATASQRSPERARFSAAGTGGRNAMPMSREQTAARSRQVKATLDQRLNAEAVDPRWALDSTRLIENVFTPQGLKDVGAKVPAELDVDCRTSICRIHVAYPDDLSATDAGIALNLAIADRMPYTQVISQPRADGSVDHYIYASRRR